MLQQLRVTRSSVSPVSVERLEHRRDDQRGEDERGEGGECGEEAGHGWHFNTLWGVARARKRGTPNTNTPRAAPYGPLSLHSYFRSRMPRV
jgi:hypothetical protein